MFTRRELELLVNSIFDNRAQYIHIMLALDRHYLRVAEHERCQQNDHSQAAAHVALVQALLSIYLEAEGLTKGVKRE